MSRPLIEVPTQEYDEYADYITEDDEPVDNLFTEKQQYLLTRPLYCNWQHPGRTLLACANVGIFSPLFGKKGIVPDVLLSMDVQIKDADIQKTHRSYFVKRFGKVPDIVIEIVSLTPGGEEKEKKKKYALLGIPYYVIFDPLHQLHKEVLTIYQLENGKYIPYIGSFFPSLGLGLRMWEGIYEDWPKPAQWLRWVDEQNLLIPTEKEKIDSQNAAKLLIQQSADQERQRANQEQERADQEQAAKLTAQIHANQERERADQAEQRADQERERADQAEQRADQERERAELLVAKLRALGIDPSTL